MCENGKHINFTKSSGYAGGKCPTCGGSVRTAGICCECGAEFHSSSILNEGCEACNPFLREAAEKYNKVI